MKNFAKTLMLEQAIESGESLYVIKGLFDEKECSTHPDLFKWSCAFSTADVIEFLESRVPVYAESAINAAIINHNINAFNFLRAKSYPVYTEKHFTQAYKRFAQHSPIVRVYLENLDKIKDLSDYSLSMLADYSGVFNSHLELIRSAIEKNKLSEAIGTTTVRAQTLKV